MSAANIVLTRDAAYLFADQGTYHHDGAILYAGRKIATCDRLRIAVSHAGLGHAGFNNEVAAFLDGFASAEDALAGLPGLIVKTLDDLETGLQNDTHEIAGNLPRILEFYVALWSHERNRAEGYIIGSQGCTFGPGYEPLSIRGVSRLLSPPLGPDFEFPEPFDGPRDGLDLLQRQRLIPDDRGFYRVGVAAEMVKVTAAGIERRILHTWGEDRVGSPIRPATAWRRFTCRLS